jgi:hypothetical protein
MFPSIKILVVVGICHQGAPTSSHLLLIFYCDVVVPKLVKVLAGGSRSCS